MLRNNRVLFYHGAAYQDLSVPLSDIHSGSKVLDFVSAADYLYLGSDFPFNHRYFEPSVVNAIASVVSADIFTGSGWTPVVDVIDETASAGVPLAQSGIISWQPDLDVSGWSSDDTDAMVSNGHLPAGAPKIFGLYWARLKWSVDLTNTTAISVVGHRFSTDLALESEYPELASTTIKTAWKAGKLDWNEQHLLAAEYVIQDLRGMKDVITSPSQILDWRQFEKASIHKTAEMIFRGFGDDYADQRQEAANAYKKALSVGKFNVDLNLNANLEAGEQQQISKWISR